MDSPALREGLGYPRAYQENAAHPPTSLCSLSISIPPLCLLSLSSDRRKQYHLIPTNTGKLRASPSSAITLRAALQGIYIFFFTGSPYRCVSGSMCYFGRDNTPYWSTLCSFCGKQCWTRISAWLYGLQQGFYALLQNEYEDSSHLIGLQGLKKLI